MNLKRFKIKSFPEQQTELKNSKIRKIRRTTSKYWKFVVFLKQERKLQKPSTQQFDGSKKINK